MKKPPFPSLPQAALVLLACFLLQYLVGVFLYDARRSLGLSEDQIVPLALLLADGLLVAALLQFSGMSYRDLLHPSPSSIGVTCLLLVPPVLALVPLALGLDQLLIAALQSVWAPSAWEQSAFERMVAPTLATALASCVLAPLFEEMLFRGLLLRAFLQRYPRGVAIVGSSLYFGVAHLNLYQFFLAFFLGLVLGWLYERSRSLIPCLALHAALNSTVFLLSNQAPAEPAAASTGIPVTYWLFSTVLAALGVWALRRLLQRGRQVD